MRKSAPDRMQPFALLIMLAALLLSPASVRAAPYDPQSDVDMDDFLATQSSPMVRNGLNFRKSSEQYNIDPRFMLAISGQEQHFGKDLGVGKNKCSVASFNSWSFLRKDHTCISYSSFQDAYQHVARRLRDYFINQKHAASIPGFSPNYCDFQLDPVGCAPWVKNVSLFYQSQVYSGAGGDLADLTIPRITIQHLGNSPEVDLNLVDASWGDSGAFTLGPNVGGDCAYFVINPCAVSLAISRKLPLASGGPYTLLMHVLPTVNFGYSVTLNADYLFFQPPVI